MTDGPRQRGSAAPSFQRGCRPQTRQCRRTGNRGAEEGDWSRQCLWHYCRWVSCCPLNMFFIGVLNGCTLWLDDAELNWNIPDWFLSHTNQSYEMENRSFRLGKKKKYIYIYRARIEGGCGGWHPPGRKKVNKSFPCVIPPSHLDY